MQARAIIGNLGLTQSQVISLPPNRRALKWVLGKVNEFLSVNKEGLLAPLFKRVLDNPKSFKDQKPISIISDPYLVNFYFITEKNVHKFEVQISRGRGIAQAYETLPLSDGDRNLLESLIEEPLVKALEFESYTVGPYEGSLAKFTSIVKPSS